MRAILLDNDILIAEACDVNWSQNDGFAFHSAIPIGRGREPKYEQEFGFRCEHQFLKNFFEKRKTNSMSFDLRRPITQISIWASTKKY